MNGYFLFVCMWSRMLINLLVHYVHFLMVYTFGTAIRIPIVFWCREV